MTEQELMLILLVEARQRGAIQNELDRFKVQLAETGKDLEKQKARALSAESIIRDLRDEIAELGNRELEAITTLRQLSEAAHRLTEAPPGKRRGPLRGALVLAAMASNAVVLKHKPF